MKRLYKGLLIALLQILIVCSVGGKMIYDRHTRPRVWVRAGSYDPALPVRGRYVSLILEPETDSLAVITKYKSYNNNYYDRCTPESEFVTLSERDGRLFANRTEQVRDQRLSFLLRSGRCVAQLSEPTLFFIPELALDPTSRDARHEQLWVEVTLPKKGPPRAIQLAVSREKEWRVLKFN